MLKTRLIPVLLLKDGILVRSKEFSLHQSTGNHVFQLKRFSEWKADEIIYLDISRDNIYDLSKSQKVIGATTSNMNINNDLKNDMIDIIKNISKICRVPLAVGGKIRTLDDLDNKVREIVFLKDQISDLKKKNEELMNINENAGKSVEQINNKILSIIKKIDLRNG